LNQFKLVKLVDLLSFVTLALMISTGALLEFTLPTRSGPTAVWGLTRHQWGDIHSWISLLFLLLMSTHLVLHFRFIKTAIAGQATREQKYRLAIGIVALITLLALAVAPLMAPVDNSVKSGSGYRHLQ